MIPVETAKRIVLEQLRPLPPVETPLAEALHLVLAEDVCAPEDLPPFDNSAMDGFALRAEDLPGPLEVVGELKAGDFSAPRLLPGQAIRIMTGAMLPVGADAVLRFEDSIEEGQRVRATVSLRSGENVRRKGEDVHRGMVVLPKGLVLRPAHLGVLASLGIARPLVHPRPRVAILSTGDEVVPFDQPLLPGQIRNSNTTILEGLVKELDAVPVSLGIARDTKEAVLAKFEEARQYDLFITSGGVSMGDYDFVGETAGEKGTVFFDAVAQQPGKPFTFGLLGGKPFFGLPGNPVSTMVTFTLYLKPALRRMMGYSELEAPSFPVKIEEAIPRRKVRRQFLRAILDASPEGKVARLTGPQGSGILRSMAQADALLVIPEGEGTLEAGTVVEAIAL
ncbi:MAG: gephyrin-like molybdotransferase Glp [Bacteroidota bacterium]